MSQSIEQAGQTFKAKSDKKQPTSRTSAKKRKTAKPTNFKELETLAREIIEADGESYYDWLHERHQHIILQLNVQNQKKITDVANHS